MAQKVQVILIDDLDGGSADETVTFALDGVSYEIDLSTENAAALRDSLATWVGHARKIGRSPAARPVRRAGRSGGSDANAIREWARANGIAVSERGRISAGTKAAYEAAH
ncbi:Lsr2 protein [Sanguibacter gelidistatuariae]|uniref:Lsr2 protein n=1 Tax=Sanguibacter gelidistatuariae TaxID=1814289 RepID=A0A1G6HUE8_9MICO|nr:Lsr2 family protein [Sanguibacter gelidistatuariae]SDB97783.1 Lsr2 protein [Sanguibacter gelidistatuariae]